MEVWCGKNTVTGNHNHVFTMHNKKGNKSDDPCYQCQAFRMLIHNIIIVVYRCTVKTSMTVLLFIITSKQHYQHNVHKHHS